MKKIRFELENRVETVQDLVDLTAKALSSATLLDLDPADTQVYVEVGITGRIKAVTVLAPTR